MYLFPSLYVTTILHRTERMFYLDSETTQVFMLALRHFSQFGAYDEYLKSSKAHSNLCEEYVIIFSVHSLYYSKVKGHTFNNSN